MKQLILFSLFLFFSTLHGAGDIRVHRLESNYQNGIQEIRVLLPDDYRVSGCYRVLFVLPVEKGFENHFGYGLGTMEEMDIHNRYQLIVVQPGFENEPWFGDHATDIKVRQASYLKDFVVPFIEKNYAASGTPEGRLLFGFSKSGWGALSLILSYSDYFGYAATWDAPLLFRDFHYGMQAVYGTGDQLDRYRPDQLIAKHKGDFQTRARIVLSGEKLWGNLIQSPVGETHTRAAHKLMLDYGVLHHYDIHVPSPHRWDKSWIDPVLSALMKLTEGDNFPVSR
jgi:hypothetical protein